MNVALVVVAVIAATPISLEQVRQESRNNTQALLAAIEAQRAQEQVRLTRSAIYPQVSLNAGVGGAINGPRREFTTRPIIEGNAIVGFTQEVVPVNASSTRGSFDLSVTISQMLYDGRYWAQIAQSGAQAEAEQGVATEQQLASEFEAVRRFHALLEQQQAVELLKANVARSEQQLERAKSLFEAGRGQIADVHAAEVNLGNDRLALARQAANVANAQAELAVWLARPGTEALVAVAPPAVEAPPAPAPTVEEALAVARKQRPILRVVTGRLRASEAAVRAARSEYFPSVGAQITAGRQGPSADPFFTDITRQNYAQAGVSVRWDLFNGFGTSAQVQQANLTRRSAELNLAQAERELEAQVRAAVVQLATQIEVTEIARANAEAARKGLAAAEARFEAGAGSTLEVRDAQVKLVTAELALMQNRIDVEVARAALERAMGQGVTP